MTILGILFDLDETLHSREAAFERWIATESGELPIDRQHVAELDARGRGPKAPLLDYLARALDWPETSLDERLSRFRAGIAKHTVASEEVVALLGRLRNRYRLGLVSNGSRETQRAKLRALGIEAYFDPVLISGEVGVQKPEPEIFWMAADYWQLPKEAILFVGDDEAADVQGATNAGLCALRVGPASPSASVAIPSVTDLERWLSARAERSLPR